MSCPLDSATEDLLALLPNCALVVVGSRRRSEQAVFSRWGAAGLLQALDTTIAWGVAQATRVIATGDIVQIDPPNREIQVMHVG